MLSYDDARNAAAFLKARTEVERSAPTGLVTLLVFVALSMSFPHEASPRWFVGYFAGMALTPLLMKALLPKGNLFTFTLSLATYVLNGLLLAFVLYHELWKADPFDVLADYPQYVWIFPALMVIVPAVYYVLQFHEWKRRLLAYKTIRARLAEVPDPVHLGVVEGLVRKVTGRSQPTATQGAEFRSVPARPSNWKLFLKLDVERHGLWRVAFAENFSLVVFHDGGRCEAVPRGGLKMVAEDPPPSAKQVLCLVRWNENLMEGRIVPEHFARIREWNAGRA